MTPATRRFIYVYHPVNHQEEVYFPPSTALSREDFLWLISKASRLHPLGFELAQFVCLQQGCLNKLATQFKLQPGILERHLNDFFTTLDQLSTEEEKSAHDNSDHSDTPQHQPQPADQLDHHPLQRHPCRAGH